LEDYPGETPKLFADADVASRDCVCACLGERAAADPLHRARIDAKPSGDLTHAFSAPGFVQGRMDAFENGATKM
jgi:hypothetical protein